MELGGGLKEILRLPRNLGAKLSKFDSNYIWLAKIAINISCNKVYGASTMGFIYHILL